MSGSIPSTDGSVLITCEYNDAVAGDPGMKWVILHDNVILGWNVADPVTPIIIGSMPAAPPDTGDIMSPLWAQYVGGMVFVPDMWRGAAAEFFTDVATNNGAQRQVYAKFFDMGLASAFAQWASTHPLALSEPPNVAPPDEEGGTSRDAPDWKGRGRHRAVRHPQHEDPAPSREA